jgi:hypothetical protein
LLRCRRRRWLIAATSATAATGGFITAATAATRWFAAAATTTTATFICHVYSSMSYVGFALSSCRLFDSFKVSKRDLKF